MAEYVVSINRSRTVVDEANMVVEADTPEQAESLVNGIIKKGDLDIKEEDWDCGVYISVDDHFVWNVIPLNKDPATGG